MMNSERLFVVVAFCAVFSAPTLVAAPVCDVSAMIPKDARVFADPGDSNRWREFQNTEDIPGDDSDAGQSAQFWKDEKGAASADIVEATEDFVIDTRYCFARSGKLEHIGFEVRTAWGWGYRLRGSINGGVLHRESSEFFGTKDEKPIPRPSDASDISEVLKPTLYLTTGKLPFASLLSRIPRPRQK